MPPKKRSRQPKEEENSTDEEVDTKKVKPSFSIFNKQAPAAKVVKSGELKFDLEWKQHGEPTKNLKPLFYLSNSSEGREKVAAFDIDFTIIKTKSGKKFPINSSDWTWFDRSVVDKLNELHKSDYRILFITNQAGIEKGRVKFAELKTKFESMVKTLDLPIFVFVATGENHFRKPSTEIWNFFTDSCNQSVKVNMTESFYVGDAAGRPKNWAPNKAKDFSCVDRMFAHNIGLKFHTPEEYFLKQKVADFEWRSIDPREVLKKFESIKITKQPEYHLKDQEIVIMIGPPASGKTTFTKKYFLPHKYVHVNRDTLQTQDKCLKLAEQSLKEGKSVIIDNTNPAKSARADIISLAKKYKIKSIRCFRMNTAIDLCHHLNYVRQNQTSGKVRRIPDVGFNMFKSKLEEPDEIEGFTEIVNVDFKPEFESSDHERIFKQFTD